MANEKIPAEGGLYISTNLTTPAYLLAVCLTSYTFPRKRDTIDTSSFCDPDYATFETGRLSYTISGDGFATNAPATGAMSFQELDALMLSGADFLWKIADDATTPVNVHYEGRGKLTSLEDSFAVDDMVKFTFEITGKGAYTNEI